MVLTGVDQNQGVGSAAFFSGGCGNICFLAFLFPGVSCIPLPSWKPAMACRVFLTWIPLILTLLPPPHLGSLRITMAHPGPSRIVSWVQIMNSVMPAKSLLACKVTLGQVWGIGSGPSSGEVLHSVYVYHNYFNSKEQIMFEMGQNHWRGTVFVLLVFNCITFITSALLM